MTSNLIRTGVAALIAVSAGLTSLASPASALDLSFLNHMNPAYTSCVNRVSSQITPGMLTGQVHDAIDTACNRNYPAFPSTAPHGPGFGWRHRHGF